MVKALESLRAEELSDVLDGLRSDRVKRDSEDSEVYTGVRDSRQSSRKYDDCRIIICECHGCYS